MVTGIETSALPQIRDISEQMQAVRARQIENRVNVGGISEAQNDIAIQPGAAPQADRVTFGSLIGNLVGEVDAKGKTSAQELKKVMTGEVDNLHQSMIAMQEASTSFTLMLEVRNKLMESYQQIMRMQV